MWEHVFLVVNGAFLEKHSDEIDRIVKRGYTRDTVIEILQVLYKLIICDPLNKYNWNIDHLLDYTVLRTNEKTGRKQIGCLDGYDIAVWQNILVRCELDFHKHYWSEYKFRHGVFDELIVILWDLIKD